MSDNNGSIIDINSLPEKYPTHAHEPEFWEYLGRTVATFGFLENVLARAIFAFTGTKKYSENTIEQAYEKWLPKLESSLIDPLGGLIDTYGKSVREHQDANIMGFSDLVDDLRDASKIRNVLCHGFWKFPDENGASVPFFVNRQKEVFHTPVDISFLNQVQKQARDLSCSVINTVTSMGYQFPGSSGPGNTIWKSE